VTLSKWCAVASLLSMMISGSFLRAAAITQLASASQLTAGLTHYTDTDPVGTVYSSSSVTLAAGELVFSRSSGAYEVDQVGTNYGSSAFSNGTTLIGAGGFQGPGDGGPITLTFSDPVYEFGLNVEEFNAGPYEVAFIVDTISTNDTISTSATFFAPGNDPSALSFEGVISTSPIVSVTFTDLVGSGVGSDDLLFGNIAYLPVNHGVGSIGPQAAPEPRTLVLLGGSLIVLALLRRKHSDTKPISKGVSQ